MCVVCVWRRGMKKTKCDGGGRGVSGRSRRTARFAFCPMGSRCLSRARVRLSPPPPLAHLFLSLQLGQAGHPLCFLNRLPGRGRPAGLGRPPRRSLCVLCCGRRLLALQSGGRGGQVGGGEHAKVCVCQCVCGGVRARACAAPCRAVPKHEKEVGDGVTRRFSFPVFGRRATRPTCLPRRVRAPHHSPTPPSLVHPICLPGLP